MRKMLTIQKDSNVPKIRTTYEPPPLSRCWVTPHMHVLVCICSNVRQFFFMGRSLVIHLNSAFTLPIGLLSVLAEPSFVNPKGFYMVQYGKAHQCSASYAPPCLRLIQIDQAVTHFVNLEAEGLKEGVSGIWFQKPAYQC